MYPLHGAVISVACTALPTFTNPQPEFGFGDGPASLGVDWPCTSVAPLMSRALISAALGVLLPPRLPICGAFLQGFAEEGAAACDEGG